MKKLLVLMLTVVMILTFGIIASATEAESTIVTTEAELSSALANGGNITLGADITLNNAIKCIDGTALDLNGKTLYVNVENSSYNNVTIKNGNIVLGKDDVKVCDGYFLVCEGKTLALNDVKMTSSSEGIKCYAVFHLKTGAQLDVVNSTIKAENNEYKAGYIVYANESTAKVNVTSSEVVGTNVNGIVHANTTIDASSLTIVSDGTTEHGINRSAVTINDSTVSISGGSGRGITPQHGNLVITGASQVTVSNMGEATIELRNEASLEVAEEASVTVDVAISKGETASGTVAGEVTVSPSVGKVAKVGDVYYKTFAEAISAAKALTGDVVVEIYDKVTLNVDLEGSYNKLTFVGKDTDAEIYLEIQGYITATGKKLAFNDLILSKSEGGFLGNAGFMNVAFGVYQTSEIVYTNCTFANGAYASSGDVTYTGCTFYRSHDKYGLWAYGDANVTVDKCVFDDYRGIKMYAEDKAKTTELTVKDTDFSALTGKPAIVLTYGESVSLEGGNKYSSTGTFELDLDGAPNGTAITVADGENVTCTNDNGACGVIVDGKIYTTVAQAAEVATSDSTVTLLHSTTEEVELPEGTTLDTNGYTAENVTVAKKGLQGSGTEEDPFLITSLEDLKLFRDDVNAGNTYDNQFIVLTVSIDLNNEEWTPIGNITNKFLGTFNGQENTISNIYVNISANNAGLFGYASVIKNLRIVNAKVSGYICVGALVGELENSVGTVDNCHVSGNIQITGENSVGGLVGKGYANIKNSSVIGDGVETSFVLGVNNGHEDGDNIGGIIGHLGEGNTLGVASSTAKNIKIAGTRKVGGIVGTTARANDYVGNSVENLVIECTATEEYANSKADTTTIGGIVGNYFGSNTEGGILKDSSVSNVTFNVGYAKSAGVLAGGDRNNNGGAPVGVDTTGNVVDFATVTGATNTYLMPVVAEINGVKFVTIADALAYAKEQGLVNLEIIIIGENTKDTAEGFDLSYTTIFDSIVIKQADNSKPFYFSGLYTGERTNGGAFVFDGVNFIVTEQYMFEGNVKLTNNSIVKSTTESNCFHYYSTTTVEAGSMLAGVIDDIRGGDLIIDGGLTDGSFNVTPGLQDAILYLKWSGDSLTIKNGAYVKVNAANEVGRITVNAETTLNVYSSKLETVEYITNNGTINVDINSIIKTGKITGAGVINVDITGLTGSVLVIDADMSGFTGTINIVGTGAASYETTEDGLVVNVAEYVAEIDGVKYATLDEAIEALKTNGGTIKLLSDIGGSITLNYPTAGNPTEITIDLNGYIITSAESTLWVSDGYVVTVKDSVGTGKIVTTSTGDEAIAIARGGKVILEGGTVEGIGYGVYLYSGNATGNEEFVVNGGTVTVPNGGTAIAIGSGKVTVNGGKVLCNKVPNGGGWNSYIYANGTMIITGGEFLGTIGNYGTIAISGGTFSYCDDVNDGFNSEHLAAGYTTQTNDDGSITVVKLPSAAKIGDVEYDTIEEALKAVKNGETIVLLANCSMTEVVELRDIAITIEGEYTITLNDNLKVFGETTLNIKSAIVGEVWLDNGTILKDSYINGDVFVAGNVTFRGENSVNMLYDFGVLESNYGTSAPMAWTVEKGASLEIRAKARYGLGYGDSVTIFGSIEDALTARESLTQGDVAFFVHGIVAQESSGWNKNSYLTVQDAYVVIGSNNSFGNKPGNYGGNYSFIFNNTVLDASRITFYEATSKTELSFTNCDVVTGTFMTRDADSAFILTNTKLLSTTTSNGNDEGNYNEGVITLINSVLTYSAQLTNNGTIKLDANSCLTAPSIIGTGKLIIDATGLMGDKLIINADLSGFTGTIEIVGNNDASYEITEDGLVVKVAKYVAEINGVKYTTLEDAFKAAVEGDTIVLLADVTPVLKSQSAITKASIIDLGGYTLTLTEDDLYFGTTTFKNGTIVVDPSVKPSTAVFWMFANQTLTFDAVKLVATGVSGTYLIGLDGNNSDLNIVNGSEIVVENETALDLDIVCVNATTGNDIVVSDSKVNVTNLDGRVFFRGNYTIKGNSEITLENITKAGFRIEAGQTLSIEDTSVVSVIGDTRDGAIHLTAVSSKYTKEETATVNAEVTYPTVALGDIFTYLGVSAKMDGTGITVGYEFNKDAYALYCEQNDVTLEFGTHFAVAGYSAVEQSLVEYAGVAGQFNVIVTGLSDAHSDLKLEMALYIVEGDSKQYVTANGIEATVSVTYDAIPANYSKEEVVA